jgi:protein TonB
MKQDGTTTHDEFSAFGSFVGGERLQRSWLSSLAASSTIYVAVIALLVAISATKTIVEKKKAVELTFVEKVMKEPPPPPTPPPPAPEAKPLPPAAAAPISPKDMKVRKLDAPPKRKELVAPKEMPKEKPKEADPSEDKGIAVYGDADKGDPAGLEGGQKGGMAGGQVGGAIALPEDADAPVPLASNEKPPYPADARSAGKQGTVILRVVILADGSVGKVDVMRGDEPFASAAADAVKKWHFQPARHQGQPITIYQMITIPFRLTA